MGYTALILLAIIPLYLMAGVMEVCEWITKQFTTE